MPLVSVQSKLPDQVIRTSTTTQYTFGTNVALITLTRIVIVPIKMDLTRLSDRRNKFNCPMTYVQEG
jgi:hypothetical protein